MAEHGEASPLGIGPSQTFDGVAPVGPPIEPRWSRRGYPFPVPVVRGAAARGLQFHSFSLVAPRGGALGHLLVEAIGSLNVMEAARAGQPLLGAPSPCVNSANELSATQKSVHDRLSRRICRFLPRPVERDLFPEGALLDLLRVPDLYSSVAGSRPVPYDESKLRVIREARVPTDAAAAVGESRRFLEHPEKYILRRQEEVAADPQRAPEPYWDPILRGSRDVRRQFILKLREVGLVGFRRRVVAQVGIFFVPKSDGRIRMVLDARAANHLCRPPVYTALATPGALAEVNLSDAWVSHCERSTSSVPSNGCAAAPQWGSFSPNGSLVAFAGGVDLVDGFYQFSVPTVSFLFGLGETFTAADAGVSEVYDERSRSMVAVSPGDQLWAVVEALPMGWSWALHFCHGALQEAGRGLGPVVEEGQPFPPLSRDTVITAPYVDNANVLGPTIEATQVAVDAIKERLGKFSLKVHKEEAPSERHVMVGLVLTGTGVLHHLPRRMWRLYFAISELLRRGGSSPKQLQLVVGHIVHALSLSRLGLSVLRDVYDITTLADRDGGQIWRSFPRAVLAELRVVRGLLFIGEVDLRLRPSSMVLCSDASGDGYAVHQRTLDDGEVLELARWRERWRFSSEVCYDNNEDMMVGCEASLARPATPFEEWVDQRLAETEAVRRPPARLSKAERVHRRELREVCGRVPRVPDHVVEPGAWKCLFRGPWRGGALIHKKEGFTALLGLRRSARQTAQHDSVVVSLGDNLSELLAFDRSRAQDWSLLAMVRTADAIQLACGIRWRRRYIESERNISDFDSRLDDGDAFELLDDSKVSPSLPVRRREQFPVLPTHADPRSLEAMLRRPRCRRPILPVVLDLFGGDGAVSRAVAKYGLHHCAIDGRFGGHQDLCNRNVQDEILDWIRRRRVCFVILSPPTFHADSHGHLPGGELTLVRFICRIVNLCHRLSVPWLLENPSSSSLWGLPLWSRTLTRASAVTVTSDMCMYGACWHRPTRLASSLASVTSLVRNCDRYHDHVRLRGRVQLANGTVFWRSQLAQTWPPSFVNAVANLISTSVPSRFFDCSTNPPRRLAWWDVRLESVCRASARRRVESRPRLVVDFDLGWDGAIRQWGGDSLERDWQIQIARRSRISRLKEGEVLSHQFGWGTTQSHADSYHAQGVREGHGRLCEIRTREEAPPGLTRPRRHRPRQVHGRAVQERRQAVEGPQPPSWRSVALQCNAEGSDQLGPFSQSTPRMGQVRAGRGPGSVPRRSCDGTGRSPLQEEHGPRHLRRSRYAPELRLLSSSIGGSRHQARGSDPSCQQPLQRLDDRHCFVAWRSASEERRVRRECARWARRQEERQRSRSRSLRADCERQGPAHPLVTSSLRAFDGGGSQGDRSGVTETDASLPSTWRTLSGLLRRDPPARRRPSPRTLALREILPPIHEGFDADTTSGEDECPAAGFGFEAPQGAHSSPDRPDS